MRQHLDKDEIARLAADLDVSPEVYAAAVEGVVRRILKWQEEGPLEVDRGLIEVALMDYAATMKKLSIRAYMNPDKFARLVLGELMA